MQLARLVADEVAEQPERGPLGAPASRRRRGSTTFAPRLAYSSGIAHACTSASAATGRQPGLERRPAAAAVATNGTLWAAVLSVHRRPRARSAALVDRRAPGDGGALGQRARPRQAARRAAATQPPAIGRRRITRSASAGSSVTCRAWPSPSLTTA